MAEEDLQIINFKMENNINWDELKEKVDADLQKDIDEETQNIDSITENENWNLTRCEDYLNPFMMAQPEKKIIYLKNGKINLVESEDDVEEDAEDEEESEDDDLDYIDDEDYSDDYDDQGGFLPNTHTNGALSKDSSQEEIEAYAWNKCAPRFNNDRKLTLPIGMQKSGDIEKYLLNLEEPGMHPELKDNNDIIIGRDKTNQKEILADIQCIHLSKNLDSCDDTVYIYPLSPGQDICLCSDCNRNLASKIMEQMALEMFL